MAKLRLTPPSRVHLAAPQSINDVFATAGAEQLNVFLVPPLTDATWAESLVRALDRGHFVRHNWTALDAPLIAELCRRAAAGVSIDYVQGGEIRLSDAANPAIPHRLWIAAVRVHAPAVAAHLVVAADREDLEEYLSSAGAVYAEQLDFDLSPAERQRFAQELQKRRNENETAEDEIEREFTEGERGQQKVKFVSSDADSHERVRREQMRSAADAQSTDWAQRKAPPPTAQPPPKASAAASATASATDSAAAAQTRLRREELKRAAANTAELRANEARSTEGRAEFVQYAGRPEDMRSRTGDVRKHVERTQAANISNIRKTEEEWSRANEGNVTEWARKRMAANARKHTPSAVARAMAVSKKQ
jgi:hypothetical protein